MDKLEELVLQKERKQVGQGRKSKSTLLGRFIVFSIVVITILFLINFTYNTWFHANSETFEAFSNVKVKVNYPDKHRSNININFQSKSFNIRHFFGCADQDGMMKNIFNQPSTSYKKNEKEFSFRKENDVLLEIKNIDNSDSVECKQVTISSLRQNHDDESIACFKLSPNYWFGGHESYSQPFWPINNQSFDYQPYVTGWPDGWAAVLERYWLSSNGTAIFINEDVPLLVKHLDPDEICLLSNRTAAPYIYTPNAYSNSSLTYFICNGPNSTFVHTYMINNFIGKPNFYPDEIMIIEPVWTTWSFYHILIDQEIVLNYAKQISDHNYPRSNLEIGNERTF